MKVYILKEFNSKYKLICLINENINDEIVKPIPKELKKCTHVDLSKFDSDNDKNCL